MKITLTIFAFFAGWALFVRVGNSWMALAVAPLLGMMFTQLGFLGHDAGHNQVFGVRRRNRLLDLDIGEGVALPGNGRGSLASWLARWQAPLFFPLMLLRSADMHGLAMPWVWIHAGVAPAALMLAGGLLYTAGVLSYHRRWPNPDPSVLGYHEFFHAYVCAAAACQYVAIARFIA